MFGATYGSQPATNTAQGCVSGTYVDTADTGTTWNWKCAGSSPANDENCSALKTLSCIADGQCAPGAGSADGLAPHPQCGCANPDTDGNGICGAQAICTTWVWTGTDAARGNISTTTSNTFSSVVHEYINNTQGCGAYATLGISHYSCGWRGNMRLMLPSAVNNKYVTVKLWYNDYGGSFGGYPPMTRQASFWKNTGNVTGNLRSGIYMVLEGPKTDLDGPFILQSDRMYVPLHDNTPRLTRAELKVCEPFGACTADGQVAGPGGCCNGDDNNDGVCGCVPAPNGSPPAVPCGCQNPDTDSNGLCGDQGGGGSIEGWRCTNMGGCVANPYGVYGVSQCFDQPGTPMGMDWVLDAGCL